MQKTDFSYLLKYSLCRSGRRAVGDTVRMEERRRRRAAKGGLMALGKPRGLLRSTAWRISETGRLNTDIMGYTN